MVVFGLERSHSKTRLDYVIGVHPRALGHSFGHLEDHACEVYGSALLDVEEKEHRIECCCKRFFDDLLV